MARERRGVKSVLLQQIEAYMADQEGNLRAMGLTAEQLERAMEPLVVWCERTKEELAAAEARKG